MRHRVRLPAGTDPSDADVFPFAGGAHGNYIHEQRSSADMPDIFKNRLGIGPLPLIGRDVELQRLLEAQADAYNGARIIAALTGEMGCGTSRLLDEFCGRRELDRVLLIRLRMYRDDNAGGLSLLRRALIESLESRPALRRQIESMLTESTSPNELPGVLGRVLDTLARRVPLVLAIDDIDGAGAEFTRELASLLTLVEGPFMLVAAASSAFLSDLDDLARSCDAELLSIIIGPLRPGMLAAQMAELLGIDLGDEDVAWLYEATRGLPALFRGALHALLRAGCIAMRDGGWRVIHPFSLCSFSALDALPTLGAQLGDLPAADRETLAMVALLGRRVPLSSLALLGLQGDWHLLLQSRDLLSVGPRFVEFPHELLFQVALAEGHAGNLVERIRAGFSEVISHAGADLQVPVGTIRLLLEGASREERLVILNALLSAAADFDARGEIREAVAYYRECFREIADIRAGQSPADTAAWLQSYTVGLYRAGDAVEQRRVLRQILDDYEQSGPLPELFPHMVQALCSYAECYYREKQVDESLALLARAESLLDTIDRDTARELRRYIFHHRGSALLVVGDFTEAVNIFRELLEEADFTIFSPATYDAIISISRISPEFRPGIPLRQYFEPMLALCERTGRARGAVQLRSLLSDEFLDASDYARAEPMIRSMIRELQRFVLPRAESTAWYQLAIISGVRGDFAGAVRLIDRSIEIRWRVKSIAMWQIAMIMKALFLVKLERHGDSLALLDALEEDARTNGRTYRHFLVELCRSMVAARMGDWKAQRRRLAELLEIGREENHSGAETDILELEADILLAMPAPTVAEAEDFFRRVIAAGPDDPHGLALFINAALIAGRVASAGARRRAVPPFFAEVVARALDVLAEWKRFGAPVRIEWALPLLRQHAGTLFSAADLAPFVETERRAGSTTSSVRPRVVAFGRLRVLDHQGAELGGRHFGTQKSDSKPRKILAALTAAAVQGRRLPRERLIDMVWGEAASGEGASNNFHVTLSGLRQVIGDGIDFDGSTYALNADLVAVDALEFLQKIADATEADRQGKTFRAYDLLVAACALHAGEFLEGLYDEWSDLPRDILRSRGRAAHLRLAGIALGRGELDAARASVQSLLEIDPTDEEAMRIKLAIMSAEGDRLRALRAYDHFAMLLKREYDTEPSKSLRDLRESILRS
ncbi:MAG: transcriptional activator protein [Chlorobi bacterium]|nr:transcriptional activator protein [Chlorobiota bacterium]